MIAIACQRWTGRRAAWRPAGELFRPDLHEVAEIDELTAKRFVLEHHYSASYPAARFRVGLFRAASSAPAQLVGVAVFSVPMTNYAIPKYTGLQAAAGVDLGRFVLLDEVEANGESYFLGRAFEILARARPELGAVISYSDPLPRVNEFGEQVMPGHVGTIYQAHNGRYCGRARGDVLTLTRSGRAVSRRSLSKIRNEERGAGAAYQALVAAGAPARRPLEDPRAYVERAIAEGPFRRVRHPGNHVYAWPLGDRRVRRQLLERFAPALPYPKRELVLKAAA
jgi:hypothetical protein